MPVYTFRCQKCEQSVEAEHKIGDPHPAKHKGCGGKLQRTFAIPEVIYKGSGFYTTDKRLDTPAEGYE